MKMICKNAKQMFIKMLNTHSMFYTHNGEWCITQHNYGMKQSWNLFKVVVIMFNMVVENEEEFVKLNLDFWIQQTSTHLEQY